ncbi:MAG TPA: ankyrin repeat domain-containing protein [Anaerolineales bacterium]
MPDANSKVARMVQPESLKSDEYQPWSRGRGVDVWAMICAAMTGDLEAIQKLVARDPNLVGCEYEYFKPIRFAVRENQRAVVDFLLEKGADPADEAGDSLLTIARDRGYKELAALFESKLKNRYRIVPEAAALAAAIKARDVAQVHALLAKQPDLIHAGDERGNQPIHWAVMTRQIGLIDYLLERGADINAVRPDGIRPLQLTNGDYHYRGWRDVPSTALQKHEVLIGYLLARGADYDISTATKIGDLDRVRELLDQNPALLNQVPAHSYYTGLPLRNAAGAGHLEVVKLLLERGADPNEPEPGIAPHGGALHAAIGGKHYEIVKLLLEHGANPNAEVESSGNCLAMAKWAGALREIVDLITSYGGVRTVELVCHDGDLETLAQMLRANPQLSVGERPDNPQIMELILRYQPDILKRTPDPTPWWSLGTPKTPEFARWLMERGLDPNRRNWLGITLLHRCAARGDIEMAQVCLDFGADIDATETEWSSTPLGCAARQGKKEMVEWLLKRGANPNLPEDEPWALPSAWAKRRGHHEISEIFSRGLRELRG